MVPSALPSVMCTACLFMIPDTLSHGGLRSSHVLTCLSPPASINPRGTDCPYAVKMLACLVLLEITTFLRETFQYLPRTRSQKREHGWDKPVTTRRFSSIVSSPGHSDKSSESNIGELPPGMSEWILPLVFISLFDIL